MLDLVTIATSVGTTLATQFVSNKDGGPQKTLTLAWNYVFSGCHTFFEKKEILRKERLNKFAQSVVENTEKIPKENLSEPKLNIIGPALEASKYYIEEDQLREMFAKLISSSMDNRVNSLVHPSFVEIIKQLEPTEAKILLLFKKSTNYPIANMGIRLRKNKPESSLKKFNFNLYSDDIFDFHMFSNVFLDFYENVGTLNVSSSLVNLQRLGIINISFESYIVEDDYSSFRQTEEYKEIKKMTDNPNSLKQRPEFQNVNFVSAEPYLTKGEVFITDFGKKFIKVCF